MAKKIDSIIDKVLADFNPKQRRVVGERFGLASGQRATLQEIGDKLGVTRERVRQVEEKAMAKLKPKVEKEAEPILNFGRTHLAKAGGIREDEAFINDILYYFNEDSKYGNKKLRFIFIAAGNPFYYKEDENFRSFWHLKENDKNRLVEFHNSLVNFFKSKDKKEILERKIHLSNFKNFPSLHLVSISKRFGLNCFGDFGFCEWEEIQPKTIRDKIYLVLRKHNQPLHFNDIAKEINKLKFDEKEAHPQTVHNELIKDARFVLVGRGIYALGEHGYEPGTVKEVIASLFKKHGPLSREEIIEMVNQRRIFKPQTILLNLQNRRYFKRLNDGRYQIKQA